MRHRPLYDALRAFAEQAADYLHARSEHDTDLPFDVVPASGGGRGRRREPTLYCYAPRTDEYVRRELGALGRLDRYPHAVRVLDGFELGPYLRAQGETRVPEQARDRADAALRLLLTAVVAESPSFGFVEGAFETAYAQFEDLVLAGRSMSRAIVALSGMALDVDEITLSDGLALMRAETVVDLPDLAAGAPVVAAVSFLTTATDPAPAVVARTRLTRLQTALRLFDVETPAVSPVAMIQTAGGPWAPLSIPSGAAYGQGVLTVCADDADELRAFCSLVARRAPKQGPVAWALQRYEYGCARHDISDYLLAARALLEPEGPHTGRLALRMAALCATPDAAEPLERLVGHAIAAERAVVVGGAPADESSQPVVAEFADHLRAILRDIVCGHLDSDVRQAADRVRDAGLVTA